MSRKLSFLFWKIHFHFFSNNPTSLKSEITLLCSCRNQTIVCTFNALLIIVLPSIMTQCHCLIIFFKLFFFLYNILNETSITLYWLFFYSKTFMWIKIKNWKSTKWLYIFIIFVLGKNVFRQIRKISKNWIWIKKPWKLVRNLNEYFRTCFWFSISISSWISISKLSRDIHVLLLLMLLHLLYFNILFHLPSQIFISKFQYFFFTNFIWSLHQK